MKAMKNLTTLLLLLPSIFLFAQSETMTLKAFDQLEVSGSVEVNILKGTPKVDIIMIEGDRENLIVKSYDSGLLIKTKSNWGWGSSKTRAKVLVYTDNLRSVEASAGSDVESSETYTANKFDVEVSSGADLDLIIDAKSTDVEVSSGGSLDLDGLSTKMSVEVSSGGSFNGKKLECDHVTAEASSGGSAKVWAKNSIDAEASSGGSVKYKGNPSNKTIDSGKMSGGSVREI